MKLRAQHRLAQPSSLGRHWPVPQAPWCGKHSSCWVHLFPPWDSCPKSCCPNPVQGSCLGVPDWAVPHPLLPLAGHAFPRLPTDSQVPVCSAALIPTRP